MLTSFFDFFKLSPNSLQDWLSQMGVSVSAFICRCIIFIIILSAIFYTLFYRPNKKRNEYIKSKVPAKLAQYCSRKFRHLYIKTRFQSLQPNIYADLQDAIYRDSSADMLSFYLKKVLTEKNVTDPYYCVLGGSGMGKTSFIVLLLYSYVHNYRIKNRPFEIELVNLAETDYASRIKSVQNPEKTILLLDALDENSDAVNDYESFKSSLEILIQNFRFVIISCRTQFFPDEEHELRESKIQNYGRSKGFYSYTRHYISPLTDQEIKRYIWLLYPFNLRKRKKAKYIINNCYSLVHRPLLLSYVEDLLECSEKRYYSMYDCFCVLIDKWTEREVSRIQAKDELKKALTLFSQKLAVEMYNKKNVFGGYCLPSSEVERIANEMQFVNNYEYKQRSLINRDATGIYKFAHKSFLEYFLAKEYFENDQFHLNFVGLDEAKELFAQMCYHLLNDCRLNNEIILTKTNELARTDNWLIVKKTTSFKLRMLESMEKVRTLEIPSKMLETYLVDINRSNIWYVIVSDYHRGDNINCLFNYNQIKFLRIIGDSCSNSFIKEAIRNRVSVINSNSIIYLAESVARADYPFDFQLLDFDYDSFDSPFSLLNYNN